MNIHDFDAKELEGDMLGEIFMLQAQLHEKYTPIEVRNGTGLAIVDGRPYDIDDRYWQAVCKDFSYRVTEELSESFEAYTFHMMGTEQAPEHLVHTVEELIDALHFMTEYMLIVGITPKEIVSHVSIRKDGDMLQTLWNAIAHDHTMKHDFGGLYFDVIFYTGTATNLLKLRPWKNTHMVTDEIRFKHWLVKAYIALIRLLKAMRLGAVDIYELYTKKCSVNNWRIGSGY